MDMQLQSSVTSANQYQTWDYAVVNGIVPILHDSGSKTSLEDNQAATVAAFIQKGTVPQLPTFGVEWVEFFTHQISFGVVDGDIKTNLNAIGLNKYYPTYDIVNENLVCKVVAI